jgi:acyl-CoA synthetase (AMP-forming)/AMP-acid ligase II
MKTLISLVPPIIILLVKHAQTSDYDFSSLKYCNVAAAPVSAELTAQFRATFPRCYFGQGFDKYCYSLSSNNVLNLMIYTHDRDYGMYYDGKFDLAKPIVY